MPLATTCLRWVLATLTAVLLVGTLLTSAGTASVPTDDPSTDAGASTGERATRQRVDCNWRRKRCFGAIAINRLTLTVDIVNDRRRQRVAERDARTRCLDREVNADFQAACRVEISVRNECGAVVIRFEDGAVQELGKGKAFGRRKATRRALKDLQSRSGDLIPVSVCTTRRR